MAPDLWTILIAVAGGAAVAAAATRAAIGYAYRTRMLDLPGKRRSHDVATPRGGGIAIVAVLLLACAWLGGSGWLPWTLACGFGSGLLLVAAVGWIDDHRPLSAAKRLLVHVAAATLWMGAIAATLGPTTVATPSVYLLAAAAAFAVVCAINVWNFMDGIDGLVATQTLWVAAGAMLAFVLAGEWGWALLCAAFGGGLLGFLPFNFPRASIFLGDVGSGGLGFACGALLVLALAMGVLDPVSALLIGSTLALDASLTLASRVLRGRRWYNPHREHLYQWMVRSGRTHAQTTWIYLAWNLIVVLPLLWLTRSRADLAPLWLAAALGLGSAAWILVKRSLLQRARSGYHA